MCLDNHSTAGRNSRPKFAGQHGYREVLGDNEAADADGLLKGGDPVGQVASGNRVAIHLGRLLGELLEEGSSVVHLALSVRYRLAVLGSNNTPQVISILDHKVEPLAQVPGPFSSRGLSV